MEKNEPLSYRNTMLEIEKRIPDKVKITALSGQQQELFKELCRLKGEDYKNKLKELKRWS